jgi:hypothetical protein
MTFFSFSFHLYSDIFLYFFPRNLYKNFVHHLPKSVNVKTGTKLNVKRKSTGETSVASDESHEHFTRSSNIEKKCKEKNVQKQKNIDEAGPSSSNIVPSEAVKRKHDTKSDEQNFCTNFWEKSKEKYQKISGKKKKKKSSDFDCC